MIWKIIKMEKFNFFLKTLFLYWFIIAFSTANTLMVLKFYNPINFFYHVGHHLMYCENGGKGNDKERLEKVGPSLFIRVLESFLF